MQIQIFQPPLRAILFDFVGVLLFPKSDAEMDPIIAELDATIGQVKDDTAFKTHTLKKYGLDDAKFDAIMRNIADRYAAFPPLWEILPKLRTRYRLGIINNGTYWTYPYFDPAYQISQRFDLFLSSAIEGIGKPNPAIYRRATERLGVTPEECLFMDDDARNIAGAREVGMQVIHWENREAGFNLFLEFMRKLG